MDEIGPATPSESESSGEMSPSKDIPLWHQEEYLAQTPTKQPESQSKSVLGNLASKSKSFFKKLASVSKSLFREMVDNPKLQFRSFATASDAVNAAQRELQGTGQH